ncbi:MAG: amino acid permease [Actinomycetota bacterium]|jgi:amino acid transporter|nr:amino acid permease [Actinomycetota bacterium]
MSTLTSLVEPPPAPTPPVLPEPFLYRVKNLLLGRPLVTEELTSERLGTLMALGVLSPDAISSSAYGTEEMLVELVRPVGLAAFTLVLPVTFALLVVLFFVTMSYREVVMVYTRAGGSYVVTRDNFGPTVAQVAAVALLIDYTVTVAVQVAAGTDALASAFPTLIAYKTEMSVAVVALLAYANLRGIREAGRIFAFPTYFFIFAMGSMIIAGIVRSLVGDLPVYSVHRAGMYPFGHAGNGLLLGASLFIVLRSFANGGSSLTGVEAISNGVSALRPPEGRRARKVYVLMSVTLGSLVLGVSFLARWTHAAPFLAGAPTVISQEAHAVFGSGPLGHGLFYMVQLATLLILYTGGNTSFNGFPFLASFVAGDRFLPRRLTQRGHRLTFSNGIIVLAIVAIALLVVTDSNVTSLVAVYAIGVFTGFTMAGAGLSKHHLAQREPHWRHKLVINASASALSFVVVLVLAVAKFSQGAWTVVVLFPLLTMGLIRLNRRYRAEAQVLEEGAMSASEMPVLRRHVVLVFVDRLDLATARAIQYARTLNADEVRAVHFLLDNQAAQHLREAWERLMIRRLPLEIRECRDRRLARAALELVSSTLAGDETEVTVLLPRRLYSWGWSHLLHDRTADRLAAAVGRLPHATATVVPYQLGKLRPSGKAPEAQRRPDKAAHRRAREEPREELVVAAEGRVPIGDVRWRQRARVAGRVTSVQVQPWQGAQVLSCTLSDNTGSILLVFTRRSVPGVETGVALMAEGTVGEYEGRLAILNPLHEVLKRAPFDPMQTGHTGGT